MSRTRAIGRLLAIGLTSLLAATAAPAQDRVYVNFQDLLLKGTSTDPSHQDWIEGYGLSHSASYTGSFNYSRITFLKGVDRSTPRLNWLTGAGTALTSDVIIDVCREPAGGPQQCYWQLTLRGARIGGVVLAGAACIDPSTCGASQSESVDLTWDRLKWTFTKFDAKGVGTSYTACYDASKVGFTCF